MLEQLVSQKQTAHTFKVSTACFFNIAYFNLIAEFEPAALPSEACTVAV